MPPYRTGSLPDTRNVVALAEPAVGLALLGAGADAALAVALAVAHLVRLKKVKGQDPKTLKAKATQGEGYDKKRLLMHCNVGWVFCLNF